MTAPTFTEDLNSFRGELHQEEWLWNHPLCKWGTLYGTRVCEERVDHKFLMLHLLIFFEHFHPMRTVR